MRIARLRHEPDAQTLAKRANEFSLAFPLFSSITEQDECSDVVVARQKRLEPNQNSTAPPELIRKNLRRANGWPSIRVHLSISDMFVISDLLKK